MVTGAFDHIEYERTMVLIQSIKPCTDGQCLIAGRYVGMGQ